MSTGSTGGGGAGRLGVPPVPPPPPVEPVLTPLQQATSYCQQNAGQLPLQQCVDAYLSGGAQAVQALLAGLTQPLPGVPAPTLPGGLG